MSKVQQDSLNREVFFGQIVAEDVPDEARALDCSVMQARVTVKPRRYSDAETGEKLVDVYDCSCALDCGCLREVRTSDGFRTITRTSDFYCPALLKPHVHEGAALFR